MSRIINLSRHSNSQIKEEAVNWIAKLDSGELSSTQLSELKEWTSKSPEHKRVLEQMAEHWDALDILETYQNILYKPQPHSPSPQYSDWLPATLAACLAIFAIAVWFVVLNPLIPQGLAADTHYTYIGEQKNVQLFDGSSIKLNTNSQLKVSYTATTRHIHLSQGEAFFEVAPMPDRPFLVETEHGIVKAVGTAFSVRVRDKVSEVTVQEGAVAVSGNSKETLSPKEATDPIQPLTTLAAGQSAIFDSQIKSVETLKPKKIVSRLAWRDGMLIFDGDNLADVVTEITRYIDVEVVISDPILREQRIGGYFRTGEIKTLLSTLESNFNVRVEKVSDKLIYLHPRSNSG